MNVFLIQSVLAARSRNSDNADWIQLLVFIIMAVIYGLGSILKTRAGKGKSEQEQVRQIPRRPPVRKPQEQSPGFAEQPAGPVVQKQYRSEVQPQGPKIPQLKVSAPPVPASIKEPQKLKELISEPLEELKIQHFDTSETTQSEAESIFEPLPGFDDPDELIKAVLYYEILDKPLSLRGSQEYM